MRGRGCNKDFAFLATRIQSLESWGHILSFLWPPHGPWATLMTRRLLPKIKKKVHSNNCVSYLFTYCCVTKDPKLRDLVAKETFYCY